MHFRAHPPVVFCRNILEFWRLELKHAEVCPCALFLFVRAIARS